MVFYDSQNLLHDFCNVDDIGHLFIQLGIDNMQRNKACFILRQRALLWETKRLYKDEFAIGKQALAMVKNKTGVSLPEDEAGFIALHIVNAELNEEMPNITAVSFPTVRHF
jgi:transcriptional regulatory protein LevR